MPSTSTLETHEPKIKISTPSGFVCCYPDEIVCKRLGLSTKAVSIILEYEVPKHRLRAHHRMSVDFGSIGQPQDDVVVDTLQDAHKAWLASVPPSQLADLVDRLRVLVSASKKTMPRQDAPKPRKKRSMGIPSCARASKRAKDPEIQKVFDEIGGAGSEHLTLQDLRLFACDSLGFGLTEIDIFVEKHSEESTGAVPFENFKVGYPKLNPFIVSERKGEVIMRKPGSLHAQQVNLEDLDDCEVYVCDPTAQIFADVCKRCLILLAPCASSAFIRDCEDCVIWVSTKQLRLRNCKRCTLYLYSKTEPIIELSSDIVFAPWCARYPKCTEHFQKQGFDPNCNLWNAVFDFTGEKDRSNWSISELGNVVELTLELDEPPESLTPPDNPVPDVTHALLVADPIDTGESKGEQIANTPQTRPALPAAPQTGVGIQKFPVRDGAPSLHKVGLSRLDAARSC